MGEPPTKGKTESVKSVFFFDVREEIERKFRLKLLHRRALKVVAGDEDALGMFLAQVCADFGGGIDRS